MSFSLEAYKQKRNQLSQTMKQLEYTLGEMELTTETSKIANFRKQLLEEEFKIVVVGEFSRGKSTFINALLGKRILPSLVRPTTTVLNIISYGASHKIKIHYHDRKTVDLISEDQFKGLIAPKDPIIGDKESEATFDEHVQRIKRVKYAEINYPLSFCQNGVQIIDTPGTNDLDPIREEITNTIIPASDAAILLLDATKLLSESEVSFLRDRLLANDISKIFVVINFKDLLKSKEDIEKVMNYAKAKLEPILPEVRMFLVAAKEALNSRRISEGEEVIFRGRPITPWNIEDTGFPALEKSLAQFLESERGAARISKANHQVARVIDDVLVKRIAFQKQSLTHQAHDVEAKIAELRSKIKKVRVKGEEAKKNISFELIKEKRTLEEWYKQRLTSISDKALGAFEEYRYLGIDDLNVKIEKTIAPLERKLHEEKQKRMSETVSQVIKRMSESVNEEWKSIHSGINNLWNDGTGHLPVIQEADLTYEREVTLFDELYGELGEAWDNSTSFIGKTLIASGAILTVAAHGISWLFNKFILGEDEKTKMKRMLVQQLEATRKKKEIGFSDEWKSLAKIVKARYSEIVTEETELVEQQLGVLEKNLRLEEADLQSNLQLVLMREKQLLALKKDLNYLGAGFEMQEVKL
ncbi:dynamin family protein [Pseudalkalibacillus hwajinpoensis]|uniref:Dynamin-type G domain-containing protein n=1 Tax=Guptibacillus hwajinpoensis TaxID=208199 RepID=A0A4U1MIB9_9BACL|nr:dynamin family protein [Pseudalkalibacillus hwajinpoensis]TKD70763.1 hypothetical protein FBF83_09115 [Pseudalkalibacillus hwajinpoensis]